MVMFDICVYIYTPTMIGVSIRLWHMKLSVFLAIMKTESSCCPETSRALDKVVHQGCPCSLVTVMSWNLRSICYTWTLPNDIFFQLGSSSPSTVCKQKHQSTKYDFFPLWRMRLSWNRRGSQVIVLTNEEPWMKGCVDRPSKPWTEISRTWDPMKASDPHDPLGRGRRVWWLERVVTKTL